MFRGWVPLRRVQQHKTIVKTHPHAPDWKLFYVRVFSLAPNNAVQYARAIRGLVRVQLCKRRMCGKTNTTIHLSLLTVFTVLNLNYLLMLIIR